MEKRKSYNRRADIPQDVLAAFEAGALETRTLAEGLAIDFRKLMAAVAPEIPAAALADLAPEIGVVQRSHNAGRLLLEHCGRKSYARFAAHRSDTVRGWAAHLLGQSGRPLSETLRQIRPLADDPHSGVREWAWMGVRQRIADELAVAIECLIPWTAEDSAYLRRFAVESTRPRGVWCAHLAELKARPELGLPLLEPLCADPEKYVQDSVANWLNDAAKSRPDWVRALVKRWCKSSPSKATQRIAQRALRTVGSSGRTEMPSTETCDRFPGPF